MELTYLGHACWLAELGETRLLFDPLLGRGHHGDVFELYPARELRADALRPDFVVVSHRHPDHFDLPSLARLAKLDPDCVVLTSDELIVDVARRLGFREISRLAAFDRVSLSGGELLTTPSFGTETEWGVMLADDSGVVFNQVDTVFRSTDDVHSVVEHALGVLGRPRIDLALARYAPLLEIEAVTGANIGFPLRDYRELLDQVAALGAGAVLPASAGSRHADRYAAFNRLVYPVSEQRFLRDLARRAPACRGVAPELGRRYRLRRGELSLDALASDLFTAQPLQDDRVFLPVAIPELWDPNPFGLSEPELLADSRRFIHEQLAPACGQALAMSAPLCLVLEVVLPSQRLAVTLDISEDGARVRDGLDPEYDVFNQVAASSLCEVVAGRQHWGQPLLAGQLRSSVRAYRVSPAGLAAVPVAPYFLYYALSYEQSVEQATEHFLATSVP